jgi:hypothetical protein
VRRRTLFVLVLLAVAVGATPAAAAHHKPNHHKPGHGTTTTMPVTTTTPTTVPVCSPGTPVTVSSGTVLRGCYRSTDPGIPAITVDTTQPVELDHARVEHAGHGLWMERNGAQINVHDSTFQKLPTTFGAAAQQRAIYAWGAVRLHVVNNRLIDGDGVHWNEGTGQAVEGSFLRNEIWNVGRYQPTSLVQAFQFAQSSLGGLEVAWNKITNIFGQSDAEDVINFFTSGGTSLAPVDVHHNLVDGAYPLVSGPGSFTGGGINIGDNLPFYIRAHHNWVVSTTNFGLTIGSGNNLEIDNNVVVNDGLANGLATGPDFGNGINLWDSPTYTGVPTDCSVHDNVVGFIRVEADEDLVRSDYFTPRCGLDGNTCSNNTSMSDPIDATDEQAARDAWEAARVAAGVTVGPR